MADYTINGVFKGPSVISSPAEDYALVFKNDGGAAIVSDPFATAQVEALSFDTSGVATLGAGTLVKFGTGAATPILGGRLTVVTTTANSTSTTDKQTIATYAIPANTVAAGKTLRVLAYATTTAASGSKTVTIDFGGTTVASVNTTTTSAIIVLQATITGTGATTQRAIGTGAAQASGSAVAQTFRGSSPTETASGVINLLVTAHCGSATAGEVTFQELLVEAIG